MNTPSELSWWLLGSGMIGGLAVFLFGMAQMTDALRSAAGGQLQKVIAWTTANRFAGLGIGAGVTAVIQSSSVTTVLLVGFVSASLMTFPQTIGVILGANIGSTVTAQIIALKVTDTALLLVALGYLASVTIRHPRFRSGGQALLGLGLVFLGMNLMGDATRPLRDYPAFVEALAGLTHPLAGFLAGAVFTAIIQSSAATAGLIIILASQQLIGLETGVAMILGSNVGTCATAALSALGKPRAALQVAAAHVCFNLLGAALWLAFLGTLSDLTRSLTPDDLPRQIANAHTLFNVANAALFIAFTAPFARLIEFLIPIREKAPTRYTELHPYFLQNPGTALEMSRRELLHLGRDACGLVVEAFPIVIQGDRAELAELRARDTGVDAIHREILEFVSQLGQVPLSPAEEAEVRVQLRLANAFESIADTIATHLVEAAEHRVEANLAVSPETRAQLHAVYLEAEGAVRDALEATATRDAAKSALVIADKAQFKAQETAFRHHLATRLASKAPDRVALFRFESEILEATHNLHRLARAVARLGVAPEDEAMIATDGIDEDRA